jgi:PST family polysaccharide transporter
VLTLVAMSADYVVVGRLADATQLGLYSLAFTLGFAPLTNFSWRLGMVLMPAAAATADPEILARRTVAAVRVMALLLLPLVPPAVILAPLVLPWALGERWAPMVVPFQILLPTGVVLALLNVVGESLAGSGNVDLHAKLHLVWAVLIVPALVVLVRADGIRGAAIAHVVVLVPLTAGYLLLGSRRLGLGLTGLFPAVRDVVGAVAAQVLATAACLALLSAAGVSTGVARCVAAFAGLALVLAALARLSDAVTEARTLVRAAVART